MYDLTAKLTSDSITAPCQVLEYTGRECISQPFEWVLSIASTREPLDARALVGVLATLSFEHEGAVVRRVRGVVAECVDLFDTESDSYRYRVTLVPRLWRSSLVTLIDIYMDLTLPQLIQKKLQATNLALGIDYELRLSAEYPVREFVVQYEETDLAFISRQCEHWGVSFFFVERDGRDVVVFTDEQGSFEPLGSHGGTVPFIRRGEHSGVYELSAASRMIPRNIVQRDYNYRTPAQDLTGTAKLGDGHLGAFYEYGAHFKSPAEAARFASLRADEFRCTRDVLRGQAALVQLFAGCSLNVTGHPKGDMGLLLTSVTHHGKQGWMAQQADAGYHADFNAVASDIAYRSPRITPVPRIQGFLTGVVEAESDSEYADVDDEGRYRVRFLFDMAAEGERQASRPLRMMQPHAGPGYGMHFPLRGGVEVLIGFVGGDPDRPIIAGTAPNPQTASPVRAENRERNVIRTGGGNEINIDDTDGSQRIKMSVPTVDTVFQLGKENSPERGAALTTAGASTSVAALGLGGAGAVANVFSAIHDYRSSGDISSVAEGMTAMKKAGAFIAGIMAAVSFAHQMISLAREGILLDEKQNIQDNVDKGSDVKEAEAKCRNCRLEAAQIANRLPADDPLRVAFEADSAEKDAAEASYLALLGVMEDRNGIIVANREGSNQHFVEVMQNDIEASLRQYDYARYTTYKLARDQAAWNALDPKPAGVSQVVWLADARAKWDRPAADVTELTTLEGLTTPTAEQVLRRNELRASLLMEGGASQDQAARSAAAATALTTATSAADYATAPEGPIRAQLRDKMAACEAAGTCGNLDALRQASFDANEHHASTMLDNSDSLQGLRAAEIALENAEGLYSVIMAIIGIVQKIKDKVTASSRWVAAGTIVRRANHRDRPPVVAVNDWAPKAVTANMHPIHTVGSDTSMNIFGDDNVMVGGQFVTILGAQKAAPQHAAGRVAVIAAKKIDIESGEHLQIAALNDLKTDADNIDIEARTQWKMAWKEAAAQKGSLCGNAAGWSMNVGGAVANSCTMSLTEDHALMYRGAAAADSASLDVSAQSVVARVHDGGSVTADANGVVLAQHQGGSINVSTANVQVSRAADSHLTVAEQVAALTSPTLTVASPALTLSAPNAGTITVAAQTMDFGATAIECQNLTVQGGGAVAGIVTDATYDADQQGRLDYNAALGERINALSQRIDALEEE